MNEFDFPRASMLLHIVKSVADHGGALSSIGQLANMELADMNADAGEAIAEYKAQRAEEAQAAKTEQAKAQDDVEEDEDEVEVDEPAKPTIPRRT